MSKKRVLLKVTGELFLDKEGKLSADRINDVIRQIVQLHDRYQFGIVVGGGNFFRGNEHGKRMGLSPSVGHQIGMLATMMNGLIFKDLLEQNNIPAELFCAMPSPEIGKPISQQLIHKCLHDDCTLIFTGGTGNPFFTTDTNAVLRALQINADAIWKGTGVDGIYTKDPRTHTDAQLIKKITFLQAINDKIGVMDLTAYAIAEERYRKEIRVFNIFEKDSLLQAAENPNFGSIIIA